MKKLLIVTLAVLAGCKTITMGAWTSTSAHVEATETGPEWQERTTRAGDRFERPPLVHHAFYNVTVKMDVAGEQVTKRFRFDVQPPESFMVKWCRDSAGKLHFDTPYDRSKVDAFDAEVQGI